MHHLMGEGVLSANATFDYISHCVSTRLEPSLFPYRPLVSFALQYFKRPVGPTYTGETGMVGGGWEDIGGEKMQGGSGGGAGRGGFRGVDLGKMQGGGDGVLERGLQGGQCSPLPPQGAALMNPMPFPSLPASLFPLHPAAHDRELREQAEGGGDQVRHPRGAGGQCRQHRRVGAMVGEGGGCAGMSEQG